MYILLAQNHYINYHKVLVLTWYAVLFKDKERIVGNSNGIQCREVLDTRIVCAKWR
jgi:hypothetical protein